MKAFLFVVLLFGLAVLTAVFLHQDPGSVQVNFSGNSFEAPLLYVFYGLLAAFIGLYILLRFIGMLFRAPSTIGKAKGRRATDTAAQRLTRGTLDVAEGNFARAEKTLLKNVPNTPTNVLHYLTAADAAAGQGDLERSAKYLEKAEECNSGAALSAGIRKAQAALASGDAAGALSATKALHSKHTRNPRVLALLGQSLAANNQWDELSGMLPEIAKNSSLSAAELAQLELQASEQVLSTASGKELVAKWKSLPESAKSSPALVASYAKSLQADGQGALAERVIATALEQNWDTSLVAVYGQLESGDNQKQLAKLQTWVDANGESAETLSAMGQLWAREESWAKAEDFLKQSVAQADSPLAQQTLADIATANGDLEAANKYLSQGLSLAL